ncbi:MAG: ADP-ribosylglycohydrolase family protein [Nannocystaceae bacterium]
MTTSTKTREDDVAGVLLGTALGDALGLPAEGLDGPTIARRFRRLDRFALVGKTGYVSDDTEQSALVAEAIVTAPDDIPRCLASFRRALLGWFLRLPFGVGLSTLRACLRIAFGRSRSGIYSAGNGAAMRAAIVGAAIEDPQQRRELGARLARVTHTDPRAVDGALYVAELAAACVAADPSVPRISLVRAAQEVTSDPQVREAIEAAISMAQCIREDGEAASELGTTGFVIHTVGLSTFLFLRHGDIPLAAIQATIRVGGDTDSNAAIVGAWTGGLHGVKALPHELLAQIQDGPFGPTHLRGLANALQNGTAPPRWSWVQAWLRNLMLFPVVLAHGVRRL